MDGDNWHTTWAGDGHQYVLQCDGQGKAKERYHDFGILGVDQSIYHYYSTPDKWYTDPPWKFIGAKMIYSQDMGTTWRNQNGTTPVLFEETKQRSRENM